MFLSAVSAVSSYGTQQPGIPTASPSLPGYPVETPRSRRGRHAEVTPTHPTSVFHVTAAATTRTCSSSKRTSVHCIKQSGTKWLSRSPLKRHTTRIATTLPVWTPAVVLSRGRRRLFSAPACRRKNRLESDSSPTTTRRTTARSV